MVMGAIVSEQMSWEELQKQWRGNSSENRKLKEISWEHLPIEKGSGRKKWLNSTIFLQYA